MGATCDDAAFYMRERMADMLTMSADEMLLQITHGTDARSGAAVNDATQMAATTQDIKATSELRRSLADIDDLSGRACSGLLISGAPLLRLFR